MLEVVDGAVTVATVRIDGEVPALFLVDAVARLSLAARRLGWGVRVTDEDVRELLGLAGLDALRLEAGGQPERREQAFVDEVVQPDEPTA
jgi:hypothetical protein